MRVHRIQHVDETLATASTTHFSFSTLNAFDVAAHTQHSTRTLAAARYMSKQSKSIIYTYIVEYGDSRSYESNCHLSELSAVQRG